MAIGCHIFISVVNNLIFIHMPKTGDLEWGVRGSEHDHYYVVHDTYVLMHTVMGTTCGWCCNHASNRLYPSQWLLVLLVIFHILMYFIFGC